MVAKQQANHVSDSIKFAHQNLSHKTCNSPQLTQSTIQCVLLLYRS